MNERDRLIPPAESLAILAELAPRGESLRFEVEAQIVARDAKTSRVEYISPWWKNLVVTTGKDLVLDRLYSLGAPPGKLSATGVGTDVTAPAVNQTQLNPVVAGSVFIKLYDALPTRAAEVVTSVTTFAAGEANFTWAEAGLFNGTVNGTSIMFDRLLIVPTFPKTALITATITFSITQL
jgi:hypothetical protein